MAKLSARKNYSKCYSRKHTFQKHSQSDELTGGHIIHGQEEETPLPDLM